MASVEDDSEAGRVHAALRAVLPVTATLSLARWSPPMADLDVSGHRFRARWAGEGWVRQIRAVLADGADRQPQLVVARRMSPGARNLLDESGIGWVDESGAARIAIGSLVVARDGLPESPTEKSAHWTPSVLAVVEALLCGFRATVAATQAVTGLSSGTCVNALRTLSVLGLLAADVPRGPGAARRVVDFDLLLDVYASHAPALAPRTLLHAGVTWQDVISGLSDVGRHLDAAGIPWAVTGAAASLVLAPSLTMVSTADVYVGARTLAELGAVATKVGLRNIQGGRLTLRPFPTVTSRLLAERIDGLSVAPWPRVYTDLRPNGVRGEEAAEHLREVMHGR